jgi:hypothetical protein
MGKDRRVVAGVHGTRPVFIQHRSQGVDVRKIGRRVGVFGRTGTLYVFVGAVSGDGHVRVTDDDEPTQGQPGSPAGDRRLVKSIV